MDNFEKHTFVGNNYGLGMPAANKVQKLILPGHPNLFYRISFWPVLLNLLDFAVLLSLAILLTHCATKPLAIVICDFSQKCRIYYRQVLKKPTDGPPGSHKQTWFFNSFLISFSLSLPTFTPQIQKKWNFSNTVNFCDEIELPFFKDHLLE